MNSCNKNVNVIMAGTVTAWYRSDGYGYIMREVISTSKRIGIRQFEHLRFFVEDLDDSLQASWIDDHWRGAQVCFRFAGTSSTGQWCASDIRPFVEDDRYVIERDPRMNS
eukprot:TRINITY_DN9017_c0_g1_i1.p1 TRINITY_DN9017_c0_g1~~TRINITY_DN9017_c0_g1_i1.p1  ORF type:complete len:110 (-),score=6.92 TRINITY_DN9017_c0_g1_i1:280-609(-)